jgi:hypothetical protein
VSTFLREQNPVIPSSCPGDVVVLPDGREALVTARVEAAKGQLAALLEVAIALTALTTDDGIAS